MGTLCIGSIKYADALNSSYKQKRGLFSPRSVLNFLLVYDSECR